MIEKRVTKLKYDDSKRVVDLTEIRPNLYIGDELVFDTNIPIYILFFFINFFLIVNHFINFILKQTKGGAAVDFIITLLT